MFNADTYQDSITHLSQKGQNFLRMSDTIRVHQYSIESAENCWRIGIQFLSAADILRIARGDSFALPVLKETNEIQVV